MNTRLQPVRVCISCQWVCEDLGVCFESVNDKWYVLPIKFEAKISGLPNKLYPVLRTKFIGITFLSSGSFQAVTFDIKKWYSIIF